MSAIASQITGVSMVCSTVCSGANQRKHQSSASLVFVREIHRWPVNSPHKGPVTRKMFPFDDVIMGLLSRCIPLLASPRPRFRHVRVQWRDTNGWRERGGGLRLVYLSRRRHSMRQETMWVLVNIGLGIGLVPSGNKPLPEQILTQILVATIPQWVKHGNGDVSFWQNFRRWLHRRISFLQLPM